MCNNLYGFYIEQYKDITMKKINIDKNWLIEQLKIKTVVQIAKDLNINPYTIRKRIKEYNIDNYKTKGKRFALPNKEVLEKELQIFSMYDLSLKYGIGIVNFRKYIKKIGIKRPRHGHLINYNYFKTISKNSAYILGFLFADGCINKNKIHNYLVVELNPKDIEILEFIKKEIQPNLKIKFYTKINKKRKKIYHSAGLHFSSSDLVEDLINFGCVPNKTKKEIRIPNIPQEFYKDFIRGYFDGDGSINISNNGKYGCYMCCSSISFLKDVQNILGFGIISKSNNPFRINFYSKKDLELFFDYIYNDEDIFYLKRKFEKFKEVLQK